MSVEEKPSPPQPVENAVAAALQDATEPDLDQQATRARLVTRMFGKAFEPTRVGRFALLARVGAGAMGIVHAGYDETLDRKVAIKLISGGDGSEDARPRMLREAQALARLNHSNVVQIYEAGMHEGQLFIAMEFVQGQTLRAWARAEGSPRHWRDVVDAYLQAARGLAAAHAAGLVHRDFKPDNAMIDEAGLVRVMDFGLARGLDKLGSTDTHDDMRPSGGSGASELATPLTRSGVLVGTPVYMSPEQLDGREAGPASDQFSFCVSLWEALHGERPFGGDSVATLAASMLESPMRRPESGGTAPGWLREVVERGLRHEPGERWPTMDALASKLSPRAGRRRAWWLGAAGVTIGGLAVAGWVREDAQVCSRAADELAEVWGKERREAVRSGFLGTELSYAAGVWERVAPKLDGWADAWVAMHTDACEATRRTGEQSEAVMDLRIACLYRARRGLDAAAKVLGAGSPEVVQNAHEVLGGLPRIDRCADVEALQADVEPPAPAEADRVETIRAQLADAEALHEAGLFDDALASVQKSQPLLEGLDYGPIRGEVDLRLGYVQDERGEYEEAEAALRRAAQSSARWHQHDVLRDATIELVFVLGSRLVRTAEALALREVVTGLAAGDAEAEADVRHRFADVFAAEGKFAAAEAEYRAALKLRQELLGSDHADVALSRSALAAVLLDQGKFTEAETQERTALDDRLEALGPEHPIIAMGRNTLAEILSSQGRYEEAEAEHRLAMGLRRKALGEDHPDVANSRTNLGTVLDRQGRHAEAEKEHRAALALILETLGPEHPHAGRVRNNLATCLHAQGKLEEAEALQRAVLAHLLKSLGAEHPAVATARNNLANVLTSQGKLADAELQYRAALTSIEQTLGAEHPSVALLRNNVAYLLRQQGKNAEAEVEYRAVLALREKVLDADHPDIAHSRLALANTLTKLDKAHEALPLLRSAWALHKRAPIPDGLAAMTAFHLAKALWDSGEDEERARTLATRAAELYRSAENPDARAKVETWLQAHEG